MIIGGSRAEKSGSSMSVRSLRILLLNHTWFADELRECGHSVYTAGWAHRGFDIPFSRLVHIKEILAQIPAPEKLDAVIYFDDSHSVSVRGLETLCVPSVFYSVDVHHHFRWHAWLGALFDYILVAQKRYCHVLRSVNPSLPEESVRWFPLWAPIILEPEANKTVEVCFRGNLDPEFQPERAHFFQELKELVEIDACSGPYANVYTRAKVVVNQSVGDDVNFRVFESLMAGALLVSPRVGNGLDEMFVEEKHYLAYKPGDVGDAAAKIRYALSNENERSAMAACGREEVLRKHTAVARAHEICELVKVIQSRVKPQRFLGAALTYLHGLENYRQTFSCETEDQRAYRNALVFAMRESLLSHRDATGSADEDFRALLFTCKCYLELVLPREEVVLYSEDMYEHFPDDATLAMAYIDDLLVLGRRREAGIIAEKVSNSVEEFLASLPSLAESIRKRILDPQKERLARAPHEIKCSG